MTRIAAVLLSLLLADPVHVRGAAPEVRRAEAAAPAVSISAPAAGSLGLREKEILKKLDRMSTGQISELAEAYARMGNRRMVTVLSQALQKRDPNSTRSRQLISAMQDSLNNTPDDPLARTAEELMARNQPAAAAAAFRRLKAERYQGKVFPWQEDLAYACFESGQQVEARAAFEEILTTPGYPEAIRSEARKVVRHFMVEGIIKAGDAAISRKESSRAMQLADQLLAANPGDPDAVALKAGAYAAAGQSRRAIDWLLSMKGTAPGFFPHQMALAGAYQEAKMFADARTAYSVFLNEPAATDADQTEAKFRLQELEEEALLTSGDHALRTGQLTQAAGILTQLEKARPGSPAVANFRAAVQMKRREYGNARDTLIKLRDRSTTKREFFDGRDNLAEALAATGAPKEAMAEYGMVKDDPRFDTLTRYEAARRSSELQARYRPTLTQQLVNANEAEGTLVSAENEVSTGEIAGTPNVFLLRTA